MKKHTPGPLRLNYLASGAIAVECDQQTRRVATFHKDGNQLEDARLFLAAPDLLEAAYFSLDITRGIIDGIRKADPKMALLLADQLVELERPIKAAIAKAEGGQK